MRPDGPYGLLMGWGSWGGMVGVEPLATVVCELCAAGLSLECANQGPSVTVSVVGEWLLA